MTDYQGCYIIIKNVPCEKCSQCGEEYLNGETLERIEKIIQKVKGMLTEIAVKTSHYAFSFLVLKTDSHLSKLGK